MFSCKITSHTQVGTGTRRQFTANFPFPHLQPPVKPQLGEVKIQKKWQLFFNLWSRSKETAGNMVLPF